jgi:signal transduction histidine kinase
MKILAIDDNPDNLITIHALISDIFPNARLETATSGLKGFVCARNEPPDVILLDILMPQMDGFDVCRMFKSEPDLAEIPVIFITATKGDKENRIRALEEGGEGFISKPVDESELKAQIKAMYRIKQARDEKRNETRRLEKIVEIRTKELVSQLAELKKSDEALRKNMDELIRAKDAAETADRLKSAFLANVSHEIRTPMNAIVGFADILTDPDATQNEKELYAGIIRTKSDDLLHLITEILDIASLESGNATYNPAEVNIDLLLHELEIQTLMNLNRTGKPHISFHIRKPAPGNPLTIYTDQFIVRQILTNYLDNAIRYTESGTITLGFELPDKDSITFFVTDTGIGIKPADHELIFMTFRQAALENRPKYGGTGLGLAICRLSARLISGEVYLHSEPGQGSTFYFKIPYSPVLSKTDEPQTIIYKRTPEKTINLEGKRLLVVEDDQTNMEYLQILLRQTRAEVVCAFNGNEVLRMLPELHNFHMVLLDIRLPDISGWELAKEIKALYPRLPVIAQTAYAMSSDRKMSQDAGCDGYLTKPVRKEDLFNIFAEYIS